VQRAYSGAYDSHSVNEDGKRSGPIIGAAVTDSSGSEIVSLARGTTESVNIAINVLGFQNSQEIPSAPIELSFGGNQGNGAIGCNGNGAKQFEEAVEKGCPEVIATTAEPNPPICENQPPGPPVCVNLNPGGGKLEKRLDPGMNNRINNGEKKCVNPNRWASPNTVSQLLTESPRDPRLILTMITDYGAVRETSGSSAVPIREFATFYVTGWATDPCIKEKNGTSNGLAYTKDDAPQNENTGVLLGHFVKYVSSSPTGTGSESCKESTFGDCIAVLTK
jgi:hypothetical protein